MKTKLSYSLLCLFTLLFFARVSNAQTQQLIHLWDFNQAYPLTGSGGDSLGTAYSYANTFTVDTAHKTSTLYANYSRISTVNTKILFVRPTALQTGATLRDSIVDDGGAAGSVIYDYAAQGYNFLNNSDSASAGGNMYIRSRNPDENAYMYLYAPTIGFKNIHFYMAITASSNKGAQYNYISYSTNGGTTWNKLTTNMDTFNISGVRRPDTLMAQNPSTTASVWYPVQMNFTSDASVNNNPNFILRWQFLGSNTKGTSGNERFDNFSFWGDSTTSNVVAYIVNRTNIAKCYGDSSGSASVIVTGGTAPYVYSWSSNVTNSKSVSGTSSANISGLKAGTYQCTVTDNNGLGNSSISTVTILQPTQVTAVLTSVNNSCNASTMGSATVSPVNGGTSPYTYAWTGSSTATTAAITSLGQGTYTCTVKDSKGCPAVVSTTITQPTAITATTSVTPVTCTGPGTASVVSVSGGTPYKKGAAYTYSWSPSGGTNSTATGLGAGAYTVTVTDSNLCQITATATVVTSGALISFLTTDVTCNGLSNGAVGSIVTGGATPYTYSWSNGSSANSIIGIPAGSYTLNLTDNNGCHTSDVAIVSQPGALKDTVLSVSSTPVVIHYWDFNTTSPAGGAGGDSLGTSVYPLNPEFTTIKSANPHITYSHPISTTSLLDNGSQGGAVNDLHIAGNDTAGLAINNLFVRSRNPDQGANMLWYIPTTGYQNIVLDWAISASSGKGAQYNIFSYSTNGGVTWNKLTTAMDTFNIGGIRRPDTLMAINPTTALSLWYAVHVDFSSIAAANNNPNLVFKITFGGSNVTLTSGNDRYDNISVKGIETPRVSCNGSSNGSGEVNVTGGTTPYTYGWSDGETNQTATTLPGGTNTVTVTDNNGCIATATVTVVNPPVLTATVNVNDGCNNANNGVATVVPVGGTGPYTYTWSNLSTSNVNTPLTPATYSVTVTDLHGCTTTASGIVVNPAALLVSITPTNVLCYGGSSGTAQANVNGGITPYAYNWSNGKTTSLVNTLPIGSYTVTVTDNDNCIATSNVTISQPVGALRDSIADSIQVACFGGTTGSAMAGVKYGTAPYSYSWSDGSTTTTATVSNLAAGTYTVTINDANLCGPLTRMVTITQPVGALRDSIVSAPIEVGCFGGSTGSATVGVKYGTAPYTYSWTGGSTNATISGLAAGTYTVNILDNNNCPATTNVTITQPVGALRDSIVGIPAELTCYGATTGTATVGVKYGTAPYTYSWTGGETTATATGLVAGIYTVTISDANSCGPVTTTVTLTQAPQLRDSINSGNILEGCTGQNNGIAIVSVKGGTPGYTYSWNTVPVQTTAQASNLPGGSYTVTITDNNNCTGTVPITITPNVTPTVAFNLGADSVLCDTMVSIDLTLTASPIGGKFRGTGMTGTTFKPKATGDGKYVITYSYLASDACSDSTTQTIRVWNCLTTGVAQIETKGQVTVYPNPNTGEFTVNGLVKGERLELYNDMGQLVKTVVVSDETMQLNISEMANGIYLARVISETGTTVLQKIVKTK